MQIKTEKYDQQKIDRLKQFLENMVERGQPRPYEVFVDSLKVIPKTQDLKEFDNYEAFVNEETEKLRIVIYNTSASPRNDQYCFLLNGASPKQGLHGVEEKSLGAIVQEKLDERDREHAYKRLNEKYEEQAKKLEDAEDYIEELEQKVVDIQAGKDKRMLNIGELGGAMLNGLIKSNPALLKALPGGEALAGLFAEDGANTIAQLPDGNQPDAEVSFEKASSDKAGMTEEHRQWLLFGGQLQQAFGDQFPLLITTLQVLKQQPAQLPTVAQLLNIKTED